MGTHAKLLDAIRNGGFCCITGEMPECDRLESANIFEALGLQVQISPSRKTRFLIVGNVANQSKIDRAIQLGVAICSPSEFWSAVDILYGNK